MIQFTKQLDTETPPSTTTKKKTMIPLMKHFDIVDLHWIKRKQIKLYHFTFIM